MINLQSLLIDKTARAEIRAERQRILCSLAGAAFAMIFCLVIIMMYKAI